MLFTTTYRGGILLAVAESDQPENVFPRSCPWTLEEALSLRFFPDEGGDPRKDLSL